MNIYVGTYAKYSKHDFSGVRAYLPDFKNKDEFMSFCREFHSDESDPELMFLCRDATIPKGMVTEHSISPELWDFMSLEDREQEAVKAFRQGVDEHTPIDAILTRYDGKWDSVEDWASERIIDSGVFKDVPDVLETYFDFAKYARDSALYSDVVEMDGFVYVFSW